MPKVKGRRDKDVNMAKKKTEKDKSKSEIKNVAFVSYRLATGFLAKILENIEQKAYELGRDKYVLTQYATRGSEEVKEEIFRDIAGNKKADAVFCAAGDLVALGVMEQAIAMGLAIPKHFSLIGYDNNEVSSLVKPPLTTVKQPIVQMSREAMLIAYEAMEGMLKKEKHIVFEPELIIRGSV